MKYLKLFILLLMVGVGLAACSKDGTHKVKYIVEGGASDVPIRIEVCGTHTEVDYETIKGRFEYTVMTDAEFVRLEARCDDRENWIKLEIYVDGKRKAQAYGKRYVYTPEIKLK